MIVNANTAALHRFAGAQFPTWRVLGYTAPGRFENIFGIVIAAHGEKFQMSLSCHAGAIIDDDIKKTIRSCKLMIEQTIRSCTLMMASSKTQLCSCALSTRITLLVAMQLKTPKLNPGCAKGGNDTWEGQKGYGYAIKVVQGTSKYMPTLQTTPAQLGSASAPFKQFPQEKLVRSCLRLRGLAVDACRISPPVRGKN